MRIWLAPVVIGIVIMIMGTIFHLQGQSVVGPESSFMYSNPDWIDYGLQILVLGIGLCGAGIVLKIVKRR